MRDVTDRVGDGRRGELAGVEAVGPAARRGRRQVGGRRVGRLAVPGGWEAARVTWDGASSSPLDVWRSADGVAWERVAALESPAYNRGHGVAVAVDGTRIRWDSLTISPAEGVIEAEGLLRASADGATWTELGTFPGADVSITRVAPPIPGQRSTWVVAGAEIHFDEGGGSATSTPRIWTSSDLSTWTAADLEVPDGGRSGIYGLTWSHDRLVAVSGEGLTWVSPDGSSSTTWPTGGPSA